MILPVSNQVSKVNNTSGGSIFSSQLLIVCAAIKKAAVVFLVSSEGNGLSNLIGTAMY